MAPASPPAPMGTEPEAASERPPMVDNVERSEPAEPVEVVAEAPAEEVPAEEVPAEEVPAEEVPALSAVALALGAEPPIPAPLRPSEPVDEPQSRPEVGDAVEPAPIAEVVSPDPSDDLVEAQPAMADDDEEWPLPDPTPPATAPPDSGPPRAAAEEVVAEVQVPVAAAEPVGSEGGPDAADVAAPREPIAAEVDEPGLTPPPTEPGADPWYPTETPVDETGGFWDDPVEDAPVQDDWHDVVDPRNEQSYADDGDDQGFDDHDHGSDDEPGGAPVAGRGADEYGQPVDDRRSRRKHRPVAGSLVGRRLVGPLSHRWSAMRRGERVNVVLYALTGLSIVAMTLELLAGPDSLPTDVTTTPAESASQPAPTRLSTTITFSLPPSTEGESPVVDEGPPVTRAPVRVTEPPADEEPADEEPPPTPAPTTTPATTSPPTTSRPSPSPRSRTRSPRPSRPSRRRSSAPRSRR